MVTGQHHGVSPKYLLQYSAHAAWLEDHRPVGLLTDGHGPPKAFLSSAEALSAAKSELHDHLGEPGEIYIWRNGSPALVYPEAPK